MLTRHYAASGVSIAVLKERDMLARRCDKSSLEHTSSQARWELLVDPQTLEEHVADCVLRVAGSSSGITALAFVASVPGEEILAVRSSGSQELAFSVRAYCLTVNQLLMWYLPVVMSMVGMSGHLQCTCTAIRLAHIE